MNQAEQMREALRNNIRGFLCERTGMFKFVLSDAECHEGWKEVMLIPNLSNEVIDSVLAAERAPLVRLTDDEIWSDDGIMSVNADLGLTFDQIRKLTHAIMDAMERVNGGQLEDN